jgi:hypothetical protein
LIHYIAEIENTQIFQQQSETQFNFQTVVWNERQKKQKKTCAITKRYPAVLTAFAYQPHFLHPPGSFLN